MADIIIFFFISFVMHTYPEQRRMFIWLRRCLVQFSVPPIYHIHLFLNRNPFDIRHALDRPICHDHIVALRWNQRPNPHAQYDRPIVCRWCNASHFLHPFACNIRGSRNRTASSWICPSPWRCVGCHRIERIARVFVLRWCRTIDCQCKVLSLVLVIVPDHHENPIFATKTKWNEIGKINTEKTQNLFLG